MRYCVVRANSTSGAFVALPDMSSRVERANCRADVVGYFTTRTEAQKAADAVNECEAMECPGCPDCGVC
jgi:hypothetical protein